MKIVVTGSEGFIGKHLCRRLLSDGHDLTRIDLKTGTDILECDRPETDLVFHLAAQTDATASDPEADAIANIIGLLRMLRRYGNKLVFTSSSMVNYPVTPYAISKLAGEHYARLFGASVVRFCNVFGPGGHSVIERFAESDAIMIYGDGRQLRTYAHVDSAVDLLLAELVERRPFRILGGDDLSVLDIADRYPDKPRVFAPARAFDPTDARQIVV